MGSSLPRDQTHISCITCIDRQILYHYPHQLSLPNNAVSSHFPLHPLDHWKWSSKDYIVFLRGAIQKCLHHAVEWLKWPMGTIYSEILSTLVKRKQKPLAAGVKPQLPVLPSLVEHNLNSFLDSVNDLHELITLFCLIPFVAKCMQFWDLWVLNYSLWLRHRTKLGSPLGDQSKKLGCTVSSLTKLANHIFFPYS